MWMKPARSWISTRRAIIGRAVSGGRSFGLRLEPLENRWMLAVITVDDDGGADFTTISAAVAAADPGDTVLVAEGEYIETVDVDKILTLLGAQAGLDARPEAGNSGGISDESIVVGGFLLNADDIILDGFRIEGSVAAGIETSADFSGYQIVNNFILDNTVGIDLESDGVAQTVIRQNYFLDNNAPAVISGNGIDTDENLENVQIDNNTFEGHANAGFFAFPPSRGTHSDITIADNDFVNDSVAFVNVTDIQVLDNTFSDNDLSAVSAEGGNDLVTISGNSFVDPEVRAIDVASLSGDGPNRDVEISFNTITVEAGLLAADGQVRPMIELNGAEGVSTISDNLITVSGSFGAVAGVDGILVSGDTTDQVTVIGNVLDATDVNFGPLNDGAGILLAASLPGTADVSVEANSISGFVDGILVEGAGLLIGNAVFENEVGINADGGTALVEANDLNDNSVVGLLIQGGAVVDAGQESGAVDYTGLGVSTGGNDFSGYTDAGAALAISNENLNATPGAATQFPPDVKARNNLFFSSDPDDIEEVVLHENDNVALAFVDFSDADDGNQRPNAVNDVAFTDENEPVVINVLANDSDPDGDELTVVAVSDPSQGTAVINEDDTITYTPELNFNGVDSFTYTVSDGQGGSDAATVIVSVGEQVPGVDDDCPSDPDVVVRNGTDENFVRNLYEDLLDRPVDPSGLDFFVERLQLGDSRSDVVAALLGSREYVENLVQEFFVEFLERPADPGGLDFFSDSLQSGIREEFVMAAILGSDEYFALHGSTDTGFIIGLYDDMLGRAPDPGGLAFYQAQLDAGVPRAGVALQFTRSDEFLNLLLEDPQCRFEVMEGWYQDYLERNADQAGRDFFFAQLEAGARWEDVQTGLLESAEYYGTT